MNTTEHPLLTCIYFTDYSYYYDNQGDKPMVKLIISTYFTPPNNNEVMVDNFKEGEKPMPSREKISVINQKEISAEERVQKDQQHLAALRATLEKARKK